MGDSHPEDEINQIGTPGRRVVLSGNTNTDKYLVGPAGRSDEHADKQQEDDGPVVLFGWG